MKHEFKIIPKEEVLANRSNAYEFIDFDKQETLEEVAEKYVNGRCTGGIMERALLSAIEFGAKWQQEQDKKMYSDAIDYFITEIKTEFKDENWDYLDFIKERVLTKIKNK
jgi:hypothetical protein